MSEFSFQPSTNNSKKTKISSLLLFDFFLFCFFILSHPLYFSYFINSLPPYIVKIFSFLSPLFVTTFLLHLALFTTLVNDNSKSPQCSELKACRFLLTTYHNVLEKLRSNIACHEDQEFQQLEELEAYKIVFEASTLELLEQGSSSASAEPVNVDNYPSHESYVSDQGLVASNDANESLAEIMQSESLQLIAGGKRLEGLLKKENDDQSLDEKGGKEVKAPSVESNKGEEEKEGPSIKSGSKAIASKESNYADDDNGVVEYLSKVRSRSQRLGSDYDNGGEYSSKCMESSQPPGSNYSLGSFGSMRKEKEWKRTLACKLFEERHRVFNVDGRAEGMDLLWETYEADSNKVVAKCKTKKGKKGGSTTTVYNQDDEDEEDELDHRQLCCLEALKFSAGKINLGMGRPKLVKIPKAPKGFGWLHRVTKHGSKKVYPSNVN